MIRRTLALAGVAALAAGLTGLAGPAAADPGIDALPDISINEFSAELVNAGPSGDIDGMFIELKNNTNGNLPLTNYVLSGCDPAGNLETLVDFQLGDEITAGSTYLVGGPDYNAPSGPVPNKEFEANADALRQVAGGVQLVNGTSVEDDVSWGMVNDTDCANFFDAGSTPSDVQSLNRADEVTWEPRAATPERDAG